MTRAALVAAAVFLLAGCGSSAEPTVAGIKQAVEERLLERKLSYEWVFCLRTKREFEGRTIFRCNVNFGEPHIVIYCAVLDGGELVTNREEPAIRCGRHAGP